MGKWEGSWKSLEKLPDSCRLDLWRRDERNERRLGRKSLKTAVEF